MQETGVGEGTRPQASAGQTGAGRGRVRGKKNETAQEGYLLKKHDIGEWNHSAGQTGVGRRGVRLRAHCKAAPQPTMTRVDSP